MVLTMQGMKPSHLVVSDVNLNQYDHFVEINPVLLQPGSEYGKVWTINPRLPNFLAFDVKTGILSQKSDVSRFSGTFEVTFTNHYGSTNATFKITASII